MLIKDTDFIDQPMLSKGKVRNIYDLGDSLLLVVTDRISAFDVIFDELIPHQFPSSGLISQRTSSRTTSSQLMFQSILWASTSIRKNSREDPCSLRKLRCFLQSAS